MAWIMLWVMGSTAGHGIAGKRGDGEGCLCRVAVLADADAGALVFAVNVEVCHEGVASHEGNEKGEEFHDEEWDKGM